MKYITCFCVYEKEDKRAVDLALITAKQVFELFILILSGVVIGKIKMVNEEGKGMLSNLLSQLKQAGKEDKLTEVLEEVPRFLRIWAECFFTAYLLYA